MYLPDNKYFTKQVLHWPLGDSHALQELEETSRIYSAVQYGRQPGAARKAPRYLQSPKGLWVEKPGWRSARGTGNLPVSGGQLVRMEEHHHRPRTLQAEDRDAASWVHGLVKWGLVAEDPAASRCVKCSYYRISDRGVCWSECVLGRSQGQGGEAGRLEKDRASEWAD